ncbi:MAG: DUF397 domain-containing protein [Pseudonocardia sp.]
MHLHPLPDVDFRRSSFCSNGMCVEVAALPGGDIAIRDSKDGDDAPVLRFTADEWIAFLRGAAAGEFTPESLRLD